jgi:hypothetical protein
MAITRAQIPEQIERANGGEVSPEAIIELFGSLQQDPVTQEDIAEQMRLYQDLFPQSRRQNIFDLASQLGAGLAAQAQSGQPASIGMGLTMGFNLFNEQANRLREQNEKIRRDLALFARQQAEAQNQRELQAAQKVLEMQFDLAKAGGKGVFPSGSLVGSAANIILDAIGDDEKMNSMAVKLAIQLIGQDKTITTEQGTVKVPGVDIFSALGIEPPPSQPPQGIPKTQIYEGKEVTFDSIRDGKYVYKDDTGLVIIYDEDELLEGS